MKLSNIKNSKYAKEYRVFDNVDNDNFYGFVYIKVRGSLWTAKAFRSEIEVGGFKTKDEGAKYLENKFKEIE